MRALRRTTSLKVLAAALAVGLPTAALAFERSSYSASGEAHNYSKINERKAVYETPAGVAALQTVTARKNAELAQQLAADPERHPANLCTVNGDGCAGDVRLDSWQTGGHGLVKAVTFTARDGAVLSGHVWMTKAGPAKRPAVVIVNGSVQAPEELYWFAAQALAKAGYVVVTYDPQGQGRSDTQGEAPDQNEGVPAQSTGTPFYDGPVDATDFLLSSPAHRYAPRLSRGGHSHVAKQQRRVTAGHDAAFDPFWSFVDPTKVGLAGHSFGASGVSYDGQADPRIKAIVAWDNLIVPPAGTGGAPTGPAPRIHVPALGMSADYYLTPMPYSSAPDERGKGAGSYAYSAAGVDTRQIVIRGGTHYEFSFLPDPAFGATLRGSDMVAWYTTAWFDRYLKKDPTANARLLTTRWRSDAAEKAVDPNGDGSLYSVYYFSRLDLHTTTGRHVVCEDVRRSSRGGCSALSGRDGVRGAYSYVATDTSPDR